MNFYYITLLYRHVTFSRIASTLFLRCCVYFNIFSSFECCSKKQTKICIRAIREKVTFRENCIIDPGTSQTWRECFIRLSVYCSCIRKCHGYCLDIEQVSIDNGYLYIHGSFQDIRIKIL